MNKKERIRNALTFKKVDRIPVYDLLHQPDVIGHYSGYNISRDFPSSQKWQIVTTAIRNSLDGTRCLQVPEKPREIETENGFLYEVQEWTSWLKKRPFEDVSGAKTFVQTKVEKEEGGISGHSVLTSSFPEGGTLELMEMLDKTPWIMESCAALDEARNTLGPRLFYLLYDKEPELVSNWLDILLRRSIKRVEEWDRGAKEKGMKLKDLFPAALTYTDLANNRTTLSSPEFLRKEFFPRLKKLNDVWHSYDVKCIFHSDGNLEEVLGDLVRTGIDGLNPLDFLVDPYSDMDFETIRKKYPRLALVGGIESRRLLRNGSVEEVESEIKRIVNIVGRRGLILGSTTELDPGVDPENAIKMIETIKKV